MIAITGCQKEVINPDRDAIDIEMKDLQFSDDDNDIKDGASHRNGDGRPDNDVDYVNDDDDDEDDDETETLSGE